MINIRYIYSFLIIALLIVLARMKNLGMITNREWNLIFLLGWLYLIYDSLTNKLYKGNMKIFMIIISILISGSYLYKVITNKSSIFEENKDENEKKEGYHNYAKVEYESDKNKKIVPPQIQPHDGVRVNYYVSKVVSLLI
jgi:hypothetical protein